MFLNLVKLFLFFYLHMCNVSDFKAATQASECNPQEWMCRSGNCIPINKFCDGKQDCIDGSDETTESCSMNRCQRASFQCRYGACVDSTAKCNGIQECYDNSDEMPSTCSGVKATGRNGISLTNLDGNLSVKWSQQSPVILNASLILDVLNVLKQPEMPTSPKPPTSFISSRRGCIVRPLPNGITSLQTNSTELLPGTLVATSTYISYKCAGKYELEGVYINLCQGSHWVFEQPRCAIYCLTNVITGDTIVNSCVNKDGRHWCTRYSKHSVGTRAQVSCGFLYTKPEKDFVEELLCKDNGEWDQIPKACNQKCGLSFEGNAVANSTQWAPWHLVIYKKTPTTEYAEQCAGTLLSAKLLISTAHCFWDRETSTMVSYRNVRIFDRKRESRYVFTSSLEVQEIYIPQTYKDEGKDDIALVVFDSIFVLKEDYAPICIDWDDDGAVDPEVNPIARIAGWGIESNCSIFNVDEVPFHSYNTCIQRHPFDAKETFTKEQMCTGEIRGICIRDGAGIAVPRMVNGEKMYFLKGIVNSVENGGKFVTVTGIHKYLSLIKEHFDRTYGPF